MMTKQEIAKHARALAEGGEAMPTLVGRTLRELALMIAALAEHSLAEEPKPSRARRRR